jgi:hypothetical protein
MNDDARNHEREDMQFHFVKKLREKLNWMFSDTA